MHKDYAYSAAGDGYRCLDFCSRSIRVRPEDQGKGAGHHLSIVSHCSQ